MSEEALNQDFRDLLVALADAKAEFLLIGGWALAILIEVLTTISGVSFDDAMAGHHRLEIDGRSVPVMGRAALLVNKRASGRPKDLADVAWLEAHDLT